MIGENKLGIHRKTGAASDLASRPPPLVVPHYDVLRSLGANALIEDVAGCIRERGCEI